MWVVENAKARELSRMFSDSPFRIRFNSISTKKLAYLSNSIFP